MERAAWRTTGNALAQKAEITSSRHQSGQPLRSAGVLKPGALK
jgi:hypothetical protein